MAFIMSVCPSDEARAQAARVAEKVAVARNGVQCVVRGAARVVIKMSEHLERFGVPAQCGGSREKKFLSEEDDYLKAVRKYKTVRARKPRRRFNNRDTVRRMSVV